MKRVVAIGLLIANAGTMGCAAVASGDQPALTRTASENEAIAQAREKLGTQLKLPADDLQVDGVEARTWNDSSLGCGKPGSMSLQVISEGYAVKLTANDQQYRVHVSGNNAVVCPQPSVDRDRQRRPTSARGLDIMIDKARQDLATKLNADPAAIRLQHTQPQEWTDNALGCPRKDEVVIRGSINGFRIAFSHLGRTYTYNTDLKDVRACPAIEAE
jgi:hypothetical protein